MSVAVHHLTPGRLALAGLSRCVNGRFITGVKAVIPGVAGMMSMPYRHFSVINVISAFVWAAVHILPGVLLTGWLKSIGLSLEMVIIVGAIVLTVAFLIIHFWFFSFSVI